MRYLDISFGILGAIIGVLFISNMFAINKTIIGIYCGYGAAFIFWWPLYYVNRLLLIRKYPAREYGFPYKLFLLIHIPTATFVVLFPFFFRLIKI